MCIESTLSNIINQVPPRGVDISPYLKLYHHFSKDALQAHQEALHPAEIFQSVHLQFLNVLDPLQISQVQWKQLKTTVSQSSSGHDHSKRSILSRYCDIFTCIFGGGSSGSYSIAMINDIKQHLQILQEIKMRKPT